MVKQKIPKIGNLSVTDGYQADGGANHRFAPGRVICCARSLFGLGRLPRPPGRLGAKALNLASRQGHADFTDPFQFYSVDRLGIKARQIDY